MAETGRGSPLHTHLDLQPGIGSSIVSRTHRIQVYENPISARTRLKTLSLENLYEFKSKEASLKGKWMDLSLTFGISVPGIDVAIIHIHDEHSPVIQEVTLVSISL